MSVSKDHKADNVIDFPSANHVSAAKPNLARQLGLFDATMLVMGGIVGSGIFINPYVVAQQVHTPALILGFLAGLLEWAAPLYGPNWRPRCPKWEVSTLTCAKPITQR